MTDPNARETELDRLFNALMNADTREEQDKAGEELAKFMAGITGSESEV